MTINCNFIHYCYNSVVLSSILQQQPAVAMLCMLLAALALSILMIVIQASYMYSSPQIHEDLYLKNTEMARKVACSYWTGMFVASPGYSKSSPLYNLSQLHVCPNS
jgi:hypothetical protein